MPNYGEKVARLQAALDEHDNAITAANDRGASSKAISKLKKKRSKTASDLAAAQEALGTVRDSGVRRASVCAVLVKYIELVRVKVAVMVQEALRMVRDPGVRRACLCVVWVNI